MKAVRGFCITLACAATLIAPVAAAPVWLTVHRVDSTKLIDARTLDFRMKDGTVFRNSLRTRCVGLKFHGFSYVSRDDNICDNMQSIRILGTGEVCVLGAFVKLPPEPSPKI